MHDPHSSFSSILQQVCPDACTEPKREEATQKLLFGIADAYRQSNNLDLSPEVNSGRGQAVQLAQVHRLGIRFTGSRLIRGLPRLSPARLSSKSRKTRIR
jgi:hypothetical protein